ncbi:MAG: tyrosine-type recombinase/integrase [Chlorogloea purpurea SAG 13.99]|jgi:integrase/recombinase XerD|nr:tyrosine-type recombinase/integrase [Chlorogloea purpurea SAG 13.99]
MVVPARHRSPSGAHASPPTDLRYVRVEEFLKARALSDNTQKAYRRELHRFLDWKDLPWGNITPRHITLYKEYLRSTLTDSSLNRALSALKSFFDWLGRTYPDVLPLDPTKTVSLNKLPSPPARDLSDTEEEALRSALSQRPLPTRLRDSAILCVLFHGLRAGEVVALNLGDYDGVRLRIRRGKDDSAGSVPLDEATRGAIDVYLQERRNRGEGFSPGIPLFLSRNPIRGASPRLGYQGLYYLIRELGQTAGIADLTPHRLRHTYATKLLLRGMDSLHARTLTRHKSEVSFKRYAKRALESAAERAFYQAIGEEPPTP